MEMAVQKNKVFSSIMHFVIGNPILTLIILLFAGACLFVPKFLTPFNLQNFVLQAIDIAIVAMGVTFVVLNGGIDFSCTAVLSLGSVMCAYFMAKSPLAGTPFGIPAGILAALVVGLIIGAWNGFSIVVLKMPSFIATLASMMVGTGFAVYFVSIVAETAAINRLPREFFVVGGDQGRHHYPYFDYIGSGRCHALVIDFYNLWQATLCNRHQSAHILYLWRAGEEDHFHDHGHQRFVSRNSSCLCHSQEPIWSPIFGRKGLHRHYCCHHHRWDEHLRWFRWN